MIDWMRIVSQLNLVCISYSVQYAVRTNCVRALPYLRAAIHVADHAYSSGLKKASGQMSPACPFCRITSSGTDVLAILGRMFQRREAISGDPNEEEEIDELTQSWLNEHTKVCQGCGSRVEKSYGCSHMECLCGYRFCYSCGSPGGFCSCGLSRGFVFSPQRRSVDVDGMIRNASGQVDLRSTLLQRKVRSESEQQRRKAYAEVIPNQIEKYDYLDIIVWYDWAGVIKKVTYLINQWSRKSIGIVSR